MSTRDAFEVFNRDLDRELSDRRKKEFEEQDDMKYVISDKKKRKRRLRWVFK